MDAALPIRIFYSTDDGYAYPVAVSMWSVLARTRRAIEFHVFALDVSAPMLKLWQDLVASSANARLLLHEPPSAMLADPRLRARTPTLARLLMPQFAPADRPAIYLDADTLALRDIGELADADLGDAPLWAIKNLRALEKHAVAHSPLAAFYPKTAAAAKREQQRFATEVEGIAPQHYINAGVFMLNLPALAAAPELVAKLGDVESALRKKQFDQDWLCCTFKGRMRYLHPRWNCYSNIGRANLWAFEAEDRRLFLEAKADPGVVHFVGAKPWAPKGKKRPDAGGRWRALWRSSAAEMNAALGFQLERESPYFLAAAP
jgi:lipopolysaccharide biosynthesis glycosyltransferase